MLRTEPFQQIYWIIYQFNNMFPSVQYGTRRFYVIGKEVSAHNSNVKKARRIDGF